MSRSLSPMPKLYFHDGAGAPLVLGQLWTYTAGASPSVQNQKATYTDSTGAVPNANPVIMDARGEASVWLNGSYKLVLKDSAGNLIYTVDGIDSAAGGGGGGGGGGSGPTATKIVVIGDSHAAQNALLAPSWPSILEDYLNASGANVQVINLGIDAHSFYRANTVAAFGTNTAVQQAIALAPLIVIVSLGLNDTITNVDGRTLTQVKADALATFAALKTGLPVAWVFYVSQLPFNSDNYPTPGTTLPNKAVIPYSWYLQTADIRVGCYCSEQLSVDTGATIRSYYSNWQALDTYIRALGYPDGMYGAMTINNWCIARMGCFGPDGLHPNKLGAIMQAAYVLKGIKALPFVGIFPTLTTAIASDLIDPDTLFMTILTPSGTNWVPAAGDTFSEWVSVEDGPFREIDTTNWYLPYKTNYWRWPLSTALDDTAYFSNGAYNGPPNQLIYTSVGGGGFGSTGVSSDAKGFWQIGLVGPGTLAAGSYTYRFKVGNEIYGPITLTITAATAPFCRVHQANSQTTNSSYPIVISFDTVDEATGGTWFYSPNYDFSVNQAGVYQINASMQFNAIASDNFGLLVVYKNGSANGNIIYEGPVGRDDSPYNSPFSASVSTTVRLAVNDYISIGVWTSVTTTTKVNTFNNCSCWFNMTRLHG